MPGMTADEAVEAIARHEDAAHHLTSEELAPYTAHRQAAEAAIREAFAIATIVRNPGDAIRAFVEQHPRRADLPWYVRGLARQFCEFVLERAGVEVPREKAQDRARRTTTEDREEGSR